jgi:hypothetical protein
MIRKWDVCAFPTEDAGYLYGCFWGRWRIAHLSRRRYVVYLSGGGPRLPAFDSLACARRFCEEIEPLTDWSRPVADLDNDKPLQIQMRRLALKVTGGRPQLRLVQ